MTAKLFGFFISGEKQEILPNSSLWALPLAGQVASASPHAAVDTVKGQPPVTIGDYFLAARRFLSNNQFEILKKGLESQDKRPFLIDQINGISIFLEKHGAFYHPLKIQVAVDGGGIFSFVLNGAVSGPGLALIKTEYGLICRLNKTHSPGYLPAVFGQAVITQANQQIGFFLGEWLDPYKEFHATQTRGKPQIAIWASDGSTCCISETRAFPIFREISRILTYYYDIDTFEQIFPWHHAAGDFVVAHEQDEIHVRLVTVRGYGKLIGFGTMDPGQKVFILPALMLFFLNLTIRMRMDRLNGTGRSVLLGTKFIDPIVQGFLTGLAEKFRAGEDLRAVFVSFFKGFSLPQVNEMMQRIINTYPPESSEILLIKESMDAHCTRLHSIFKNL